MRVPSINLIRAAGGPWRFTGAIRDLYKLGIARLVAPPHAQVLDGVVLGIRSGMPGPLNQALIDTGLIHLLVLSGLKVAVFARLVTAALGGILGHSATWPAIALVALYAAVGGGTPAAVRAATMGGLVLLGSRLGRPAHVWTSLAATAAGMTAWRPELAWDVGFQLSFLGTAAIILLTPPIQRRLGRIPAAFREPLAVTCAAQIGTAPLMAADFHVISPVAPIANALVLPLLPALIAAGLVLAPLALLPVFGGLLAIPVTALLAYLEQVAGLLARLPGAALPVAGLPPGGGLAYYLALGGAVLAAGGTAMGRHRRAGLAVGLLGPLIVTGAELAAWSWPRSEAAVLNVGDGSAMLLRGPSGFVLVDGGPSPARLQAALGGRLAPWQGDLAGLVITSDSIGRVGGLAGFDHRAAAVAVPAGGLPGTAWRKAELAAITTGAQPIDALAGQSFQLAGLDFQVLSPEPGEPGDEQGWGDIALRVTGPSGRALCDFSDLIADAQRLAAEHLRVRCDYLVFGSRAAPDPDLVAALDPSQLVLSAAAGTRAPPGLPAGLLRRTDQEGDIVLAL